jgi:hypothetical protein
MKPLNHIRSRPILSPKISVSRNRADRKTKFIRNLR